MKRPQLSLRWVRLLSTRILLLLALASTLAAAPAAPESDYGVFISTIQAPPKNMCLHDTAAIGFHLKANALHPSSAATYSTTASIGMLSKHGGQWARGTNLFMTYTANQEGKATIKVSAVFGGESGSLKKPFTVNVKKCNCAVEVAAVNRTKDPTWVWLESFEGTGSITDSESDKLSGTGTYKFYVDGVWKAPEDAMKCYLTKALEGGSSFTIKADRLNRATIMVTLEFSTAEVPAAEAKCVDKEGKEAKKEMFPSFTWDPATDVVIKDAFFYPGGGEYPFTFGEGGYGSLSVVRRTQ